MNYCTLYSPEFLSRPTAGRSISGNLEFIPGISTVVDHCNGLLLIAATKADYVANPATRRWARPPPCPMMPRRTEDAIKCLVYDPTMSPHYEWPPSSYALQVFSSITGRWEERSFVLEGEHPEEVRYGWRVINKIHWRGALYVRCRIGLVLRISMSNAKCRWVPRPPGVEVGQYGSLGTSEKRVCCAFQHDCQVLRIFHLNESSGQVGWELKHTVDFTSFARKLHERDYSEQLSNIKGPWILQDINYYKCPYGNDKHKEAVEDDFEWNSDDDDVLNTENMVEGSYKGYTSFLGFHPCKEIVFLNAALSRAVAYHWNASKFQDLGNIYPKDYLESALHCAQIETSFIYTPCWMEDFPENNLEYARIED
ncbi:hypothetical protein PAHAL_9G456200 [Panicum hallii]|uniref:F-box associated domain-containing protein n=1 Tax=Panicum hallii TaxID=206008 RepID=A0A2S3IQI4_9POAL|nr:uncharacterized protein LOC112873294 [Panicum hallii]PAN49565.1 hypothetical protein PAHAL_9G456200 [Panicum hallii]